jgi:hypothetical protein
VSLLIRVSMLGKTKIEAGGVDRFAYDQVWGGRGVEGKVECQVKCGRAASSEM